MKNKTYAVAAGLLLALTLQSAMAAEHHGKRQPAPARQSQAARPADAYAAWPAAPTSPAPSYYSGGYSAPAGH